MKPRALAVLQARTSSRRLPGKVLMPILGAPMLFRQIERIRRASEIGDLVVATSSDPSDDALAQACASWGVACFRGSLDDVLGRFEQAAAVYPAQTVVRLTGDCPLADPAVIDATIRYFHQGGFDYASNCIPPTFPDGLDVEVMRLSCLREAAREAVLPSEREHVTPFLRAHPQRYRLGNYAVQPDMSGLRWTVDEPADFEFVRLVYERLFPGNPQFAMADVLALLDRSPELRGINTGIERNAGAKGSLLADAQLSAGKHNV